MAEYVEKAAFREHLDSVPPFTKGGQRDPKYDFAKTVFLSELAAYPAADVAPVIHGRWIDRRDGYTCCSVCGEDAINATTKCRCGEIQKTPFCPYCGAKMDKEEE